MAKKLVSEIVKLAGKDGWDAMSIDLKKAIGSVPPPLEQKVIDLINSEIKAKNGQVDLWGILNNLGSVETLNETQQVQTPSPKPAGSPKTTDTDKTNAPATKETPITRAKNTIKNFRENKWVKRTAIGCGVIFAILMLVFIFWFLGGSNPEPTNENRIQNQQQPQQPNQQQSQTESVPAFQPETTVDYKSIAVVGVALKLIILALILVPVLGYLDARERFETSDVVFAIGGFVGNYLLTWKPIVAFLTTFEPIGTERTALFFVTAITFALVSMKAATGKRDTTNLGLYFAGLALAGAAIGRLGAIQVAFNVPTQPVYLLQDLPSAILTKKIELIQFSLLVYSMFGLSILFYLVDIFFPVDKETRWEAVVIAVIVIAGFYIAQIWVATTVALALAVAISLVIATLARRTGRGMTSGESPLSRAVTRAFEYTAWDGVAIGVVISVLLFLSGLA